MKEKYVFIWRLSAGRWDNKAGKMNFEDRYPMPGCGSDSLMQLDGRLSLDSMLRQARELTKKRGGVGFSIGRLVPHDPENYYCQSIVKFTEI